jgi:Transglycosylase SLT domain
MKLHEIYCDQSLNEGTFHRAVGAALMVLGSIGSFSPNALLPSKQDASIDKLGTKQSVSPTALIDKLTSVAAQQYKVNQVLVKNIVTTAVKYQYADFPTAKDILAVVGTESSFNPGAVSQLKKDPAIGLMQIRPGVWNIPKSNLSTVDGQIKAGADILHQYYKKLGSAEAALHAYNVGLTRHNKSIKDPSKANPRYVPKILAQKDLYNNV